MYGYIQTGVDLAHGLRLHMQHGIELSRLGDALCGGGRELAGKTATAIGRNSTAAHIGAEPQVVYRVSQQPEHGAVDDIRLNCITRITRPNAVEVKAEEDCPVTSSLGTDTGEVRPWRLEDAQRQADDEFGGLRDV